MGACGMVFMARTAWMSAESGPNGGESGPKAARTPEKRPERGPNAGENSLRKKRKKIRFFPQKTLAFFSPMCYYNQASSEA